MQCPTVPSARRAAGPRIVLMAVLAACGGAIGSARVSAATISTIDEGPVAGQPSAAIGADGLPVMAYRTLQNKLRVA